MAGNSPAKRCASMDLPEPGGPTIKRPWPPAAAISSARRAAVWPFTSARSGPPVGLRGGCACSTAQPSLGRGSAPGGRKACTTSSRWRTHHRAPGTRAASSALPGAAPGRRCCLACAAPGWWPGRRARAQLAGQGQLARKFMPRQPAGIDLPTGGEDAQRNRQVEPPGILGQIGRCQVHGDAFVVRESPAPRSAGAERTRSRASSPPHRPGPPA